MIVAMVAAVLACCPAQGGDCEAELRRLSAAHARLEAELTEARRELALRRDAERTAAADVLRAWARRLRAELPADESRPAVLAGLAITWASMSDFAAADARAAAVLGDALQELRPEMEALARARSDGWPGAADRRRAAARLALREQDLRARMHADPAAARELLEGRDRVEAARLLRALRERPIAWRGTLVRAIDYEVVPWQAEVDCAGLLLRVALDARARVAPGVEVGGEVIVRGRLAEIDSEPAAGIYLVERGASLEPAQPPRRSGGRR